MAVNLTAYDNEQVDYADPNFRIKIWTNCHPIQATIQYGPWHYHEEVEWITVLKGTMTIETTQQTYMLQAGDVVMLGSNELHRSHKYGQSPLIYCLPCRYVRFHGPIVAILSGRIYW